MELTLTVYSLLVLISAIVSFTISFIAWRHRHGRLVNTTFALLMVSVGIWALMNFLELSLSSFQAKIIASNLVYVGILGTVGFWFLFAAAYTGRDYLLTWRNLLLLCLEPVLLLIFLWLDPWSGLIRQSVWLDSSGAFPILMVQYGFGFWLHSAYSYLLLFAGTLMLIRYVVHAPKIYRRQAVVILIGISIPWVLNALYLLGITRYGLTAAGFTFTGVVLGWGLLRLRLLDVVPTARTAVFASLSDAIFTIDMQNRVVDMNPAAGKLVDLDVANAVGLPVETVFASQPDLIAAYQSAAEAHVELVFTQTDPPRYYDMHISSVLDNRQRLVARVVVVRNVTAQKVAEKAERNERLLAEALRDVAVALNSTLNPQEVFARILVNVDKVLPHDAANIMLYEAGFAYLIGSRGYIDSETVEAITKRRLLVAETPTLQEMMTYRRPVVVSNVHQDSRWHKYSELSWIGSYIGVPILQDNEVIGFLNLDSRTPDTFQPEHVNRLSAFADQAAIALKNARLYAELAERNQELDAFSRTIAHDLNAPLALIKGYGDLLATSNLSGHDGAYLQKILDTTDRMTGMIDQLLFLARLRDVERTAVSVDILPVLLAVRARYENEIEKQGIKLTWSDDLPPAKGHAVWLEEVFANLVGNAIKYIGKENDAPEVTISGVRQGDLVLYQVRDNGLGIEEDALPVLFDMFTRYHREEAPGTGLGLPIVERIVTKLGGEIGVESTVGEGSVFWFLLPAG